MQVARHFLSTDPKLHKDVSLIPDYSIESHSKDHEQYLDVSRTRKRRAKALLGESIWVRSGQDGLLDWMGNSKYSGFLGLKGTKQEKPGQKILLLSHMSCKVSLSVLAAGRVSK